MLIRKYLNIRMMYRYSACVLSKHKNCNVDTFSYTLNSYTSYSPDEYLTMMFDICRTDDGKAAISLLLEVKSRSLEHFQTNTLLPVYQ